MVFDGIYINEAFPYLDDTCIHSKDLKGHCVSMKKVFYAYRHAGLKVQPTKCTTFLGKVGYYCRFIKDCAAVAKPWTDIVGKDKDRVIKKHLLSQHLPW
jgi:hypothetical protein